MRCFAMKQRVLMEARSINKSVNGNAQILTTHLSTYNVVSCPKFCVERHLHNSELKLDYFQLKEKYHNFRLSCSARS
jgi:hypothetical protein